NWSKAGYPGNIPVYSTIKNILDFGGAGNGIDANDAALQNAINSLNDQNGTIYFPAGSFLFIQPITLRSGIVLKGEGAPATTLLFNLSGPFSLINIFGDSTSTISHITSVVSKDAVSFPVDNVSLFSVNDYIKIYQNDAALTNDDYAFGSVGQIVKIDSIKNNSIYFSNALRKSYLLTDTPRIRKLEMAVGIGIECLKIKRLDATAQQTANIRFADAANCWIKGVESDSCNFAHIKLAESTNIEITNNYFHGAFAYNDGGKAYGISCEYTSGDCLIENNVFKHLRHSMLVQSGANGNVFAYNYSLEPFKSESTPFDLTGDIVLHGNYPYLNLFEGNIVQNIVVDASHGINGPFNTFFRNRAKLYGILFSAAAGDSTNIIGNEITGTGLLKGNYYVQGNGNFEYGNNKNDTIRPAGTTMLTQRSLFRSSTPSYWNIGSLWPSIGMPNRLNSGSIPAYQRFTSSTNITYCLTAAAATYTFTGNGNWNMESNWMNNKIPPAVLYPGSRIIIDPPLGQKCILNIPYFLNPGVLFTVRQGKVFEVQSNLTFIK
ncbi:MAG: glycosyl hydrolase family 28-related protein, partial [Bacteroidota bacterium]